MGQAINRRRAYGGKPVSPYEREYLTIYSLANDNTISWVTQDSTVTKTIYWSKDKVTWNAVTSTTSGVNITTLQNGEKVYLKGGNPTYATSLNAKYNHFSSTNEYGVEGNIMSLIHGDSFLGKKALSSLCTFAGLFRSSSVKYAENLILPATTLANYCYAYMFCYCSSLMTTPELPATTLTNYCYYYMFYQCYSLTATPALPATELGNQCYRSMFAYCYTLTTTPKLPATTLTNYCYCEMFVGCTSLTTTPVLPATTLADSCYQSMFQGCTRLTTAPNLPATTLTNYCYYYMFQDCTSLTTAPQLPATTLADNCYRYMFRNCTALAAAPSTLPAETLTSYCYAYMFYGCTSLTTAPELPATTLLNNSYYSMFYGCTSLNYIKCLATNISASSCTHRWTYNVKSSGTFVKDSTMTSWTTGANGIPSGWTTQNA